ncbi:putative Magnetosome membrane protein MamB, Co/Zn/Cd cation transporter. Cation diffusion facilitator family [Candidatus Desulfarcum epimagneticum]|uniref:Putative Magnetosome membrane protein MamB, Co/Zn/Cd cation transporter. Cation diffusion facilitator family n=1 Tax=uncultured Desulfobacteraceae bacterium TaxID=218296 RepID=A0A484HI10_9BACT|nr:putative Magnetosome membrane protein MamB, Co/Zn/Cd cation transporter. Cation diffusion facilitator family [uncultured Desulfobacteraceae bacterium]
MKHNACKKCIDSVGNVNVIGNVLMIALKGYLGVVGGSKGLIADAIHSCADLLATIVMIIGLKISNRETSREYPYGYGKAEHVVAIVIYIFLFVIAGYIIYEGVLAIIEGREIVPCAIAAWGAVLSIFINELMFRLTHCAGTQANSPAIVAKAWETRTDVYSSIAVVIGIIGARLGFHFMDPLAAVVVGLLIFRTCVEMTREAVLSLMDRIPEGFSVDELQKRIAARIQDIVVDIVDVKVRDLGPDLEYIVKAMVPDCISIAEAEKVKDEIRRDVSELEERKTVVVVQLLAFNNDKKQNQTVIKREADETA